MLDVDDVRQNLIRDFDQRGGFVGDLASGLLYLLSVWLGYAQPDVAGLDLDWRGRPFGPMPALMAVAEYVTKLHAVCARCGAPATRSQRLVAAEGRLFVGGAAEYEARCRSCFVAAAVGDGESSEIGRG